MDHESNEITDKGNLAQPAKVNDASPEEILNYTKTARLAMANDMASAGIPQGRDRRVFLELLNDLDKNVLDVKRLDLDTQTANNDNEIAATAIRIKERHLKAIERVAHPDNRNTMPITDVSGLPPVTIDADEFSNVVVDDDFDSFVKRHDSED